MNVLKYCGAATLIALTTMFCTALLAVSAKMTSSATAAKTREPVACASDHYSACMGIMSDKYLSTSAAQATKACAESAAAICSLTKYNLGE